MDKQFVVVLINDSDNTVEGVYTDETGPFVTEIEAVAIGSEIAERFNSGKYRYTSLILPLKSFMDLAAGKRPASPDETVWEGLPLTYQAGR